MTRPVDREAIARREAERVAQVAAFKRAQSERMAAMWADVAKRAGIVATIRAARRRRG